MTGLAFEFGDEGAVRRNFERIVALLGTWAQVPAFVGEGDPNGTVEASPPAVYFNLDGGSSETMALKVTGDATNTGWEWVQTTP